jgi:hypothetical protein
MLRRGTRTLKSLMTMPIWFRRGIVALAAGFIGAALVPFLSVEVYRLLLRLGADNYEILIRLSTRFQTPAEKFAQQTVLYGAILGVGSGAMLAKHLEGKSREVWMLSKICSLFALLFLYGILTHPLYVALGNQELGNALPLAVTLFLVPAVWSFALLFWGFKAYGAKEWATRKWGKREIGANMVWILFIVFLHTLAD